MKSKKIPALALLAAGLLCTAASADPATGPMTATPEAAAMSKMTPSSGRRPETLFVSKTAREVSSREAGVGRETLPGARFISTDDWYKMREIPKTGLYIIDRENVPNGLAEELKEQGFTLARDGTLTDAKGRQRAAFVGGHLYSTVDAPSKAGGLMEHLRKFAQGASDAIISPAKAGNPYRFACWSWHYMAVYDNGFCRSQTLTVWDDAWGPNGQNTCSGELPHTNITNLQVRATISNAGNGGSENICNGANHCTTTTEWDIGCWWPAYGSTALTAFASGKDHDPAHGNPSAQASTTWFH